MGVPLSGRNALQPQLNKQGFSVCPGNGGEYYSDNMRVKRVPLTNSGTLHVATRTEFQLCFNLRCYDGHNFLNRASKLNQS